MMKMRNILGSGLGLGLGMMVFALAVAGQVYGQEKEAEGEGEGKRIKESFSEMRSVGGPDEYKVHVGLDAGINSPRGNAEATPELGLNIGYQPYVPFGVGADISTSRLDDETQHQRTSLLARGTYNLAGDIPVVRHSFIGVGAGPMFISDGVEWTLAPLVGFDIPFNVFVEDKSVTLGLNAKYLMTTDTANSLVANASLKYWF